MVWRGWRMHGRLLAGRIGLCGIMRRGGGRSWPARDGTGWTWNRAGIEYFERHCGSAWRSFEPGCGVRTYAICGDAAEGGDRGERTCGYRIGCQVDSAGKKRKTAG